MRYLVLLLAACSGGGGEGLEVQESSCSVGQFNYVHDLTLEGTAMGQGSLTITGHSFINSLKVEGEQQLGVLQLRAGTVTIVRVEFEELLAQGETVDARGFVTLSDQGVAAGNCETGGFSGRISDFGDGWKFTLVDLHVAPYCSGAEFQGSFAGCTRSGN